MALSERMWQLKIEKRQHGKGWVLNLAPITDPTPLMVIGPFKTAKAARIEADKLYPRLMWANARKAYMTETIEHDPTTL